MANLTDTLRAFYAETGLRESDAMTAAVTTAFMSGGAHEAAHMLKHLRAVVLEASGAERDALLRWADQLDANPNDRTTIVMAPSDG